MSIDEVRLERVSTWCQCFFIEATAESDRVGVYLQPAVTVKEEEQEPAWSVLRDDFMMGATMKDWDKESDGEQADTSHTGQGPQGSDSD